VTTDKKERSINLAGEGKIEGYREDGHSNRERKTEVKATGRK